jgi:hypothetical protein
MMHVELFFASIEASRSLQELNLQLHGLEGLDLSRTLTSLTNCPSLVDIDLSRGRISKLFHYRA